MKQYSPEIRTEGGLATSLALVAGYLDGYGLLVLGTYVSFMSGNTTMTGVRTGQGRLLAAYPAAIAIVFFVLGSFSGNLITHSKFRNAHRVLFGIIATLIAFTGFLAPHNASSIAVAIAILSAGTGMLNPAVSKVGVEPVSLTFMTGTLSRIGAHLASAIKGEELKDTQGPGDSHLKRARLDATVWFSFFAGAALAGFLVSRFHVWALIPPCLVMLTLAIFSNSSETKA